MGAPAVCSGLYNSTEKCAALQHHMLCNLMCGRLDEVCVAWTPIGSGTTLALVSDAPLGPTNPVALKITAENQLSDGPNANAVSGVANSGFWGISVQPDTAYHMSLYLKRKPGSDAPSEVQALWAITIQ